MFQYRVFTSPDSFPTGDNRGGSITSDGTIITSSQSAFSATDIGKFIYADNQLRTINQLLDQSTVTINAEFVNPLVDATFTVVTPIDIEGFSIANTGETDAEISTPDAEIFPIVSRIVIDAEFEGAIAINPLLSSIMLAYEG